MSTTPILRKDVAVAVIHKGIAELTDVKTTFERNLRRGLYKNGDGSKRKLHNKWALTILTKFMREPNLSKLTEHPKTYAQVEADAYERKEEVVHTLDALLGERDWPEKEGEGFFTRWRRKAKEKVVEYGASKVLGAYKGTLHSGADMAFDLGILLDWRHELETNALMVHASKYGSVEELVDGEFHNITPYSSAQEYKSILEHYFSMIDSFVQDAYTVSSAGQEVDKKLRVFVRKGVKKAIKDELGIEIVGDPDLGNLSADVELIRDNLFPLYRAQEEKLYTTRTGLPF